MDPGHHRRSRVEQLHGEENSNADPRAGGDTLRLTRTHTTGPHQDLYRRNHWARRCGTPQRGNC